MAPRSPFPADPLRAQLDRLTARVTALETALQDHVERHRRWLEDLSHDLSAVDRRARPYGDGTSDLRSARRR